MSCSDATTAPRGIDETAAATWKTWVLTSGSEVRPVAPPAEGSAQARTELDEILRVQSARTAASDSLVRHWDGRPTDRWHEKTLELLDFYWPLLPDVRIATPVRSARILALVNVAMYDALVAVWDAKAAYHRRAPSDVEGRVAQLAEGDGASSYPSMHAAVAAAAAGVLSHLFPLDDTLRLHALEREAGDARIAAGVAYRSDVDAGY
ncbi:MAG TPA: hypothetical protein VIP11_20700, partial [Gemmatimonadaceae bacterium]